MPNSIARSMVLTLLILAACGGDQQSVAPKEVIPDIETVKPHVERLLTASDGTLLAPRDVVGANNALLILDASSDEIWEMSLIPPHELRRTSRPRLFGQTGVFALTKHSAGLSLLGVDGSLRVMRRDDSDQLARTIRAFAPRHRPIALGEWTTGGWVAVHAVLVLEGDLAADSVIVSTIDTAGRVARRYGFERSGSGRRGMFLVDRMSARTFGSRVIIAGAEPARVITIAATTIAFDTLINVPVRELNETERAGLHRVQTDARAPAMLRESRTPTQRPPVLDALPFDGGYLVIAQGGEESQVADLYCGRTFRRTVLARSTLSEIYVTEHGLVAIDEPSVATTDAPTRLSFYRAQDFIAECTK